MRLRTDALRRWYVLMAMVGAYTLSIADRYVVSTVLEPLKRELLLTDSGVAFLTGVSLALFYVVFSFPVAWLMDRASRRNLIAACIALWSLMTVLSGLSRNYWQLLLTRFGVGIGEAGATPGAGSLISDYFPAERRPMAMTVFSLGAPFGAWLGADVAGRIADSHGWRAAFLALGIPGVLAALLILFTIREPSRGGVDSVAHASPASFGDSMKTLWRNRAAVHLIAGCGLTTLWGWGLMWWTPAYLMRAYELTAGEAGAITGPMHLLGGTIATALTGWLMSRPSMADPRRILWFLSVIVTAGTVVSLVLFQSQSLLRTTWLLWIFIPSIYLYIGPGFGILNNLAEPRMRATFGATSLFVANFANLVVAPQLVGVLSDGFAHPRPADATSLRLALLCLAPSGFWAAGHYVKCARLLRPDLTTTR